MEVENNQEEGIQTGNEREPVVYDDSILYSINEIVEIFYGDIDEDFVSEHGFINKISFKTKLAEALLTIAAWNSDFYIKDIDNPYAVIDQNDKIFELSTFMDINDDDSIQTYGEDDRLHKMFVHNNFLSEESIQAINDDAEFTFDEDYNLIKRVLQLAFASKYQYDSSKTYSSRYALRDLVDISHVFARCNLSSKIKFRKSDSGTFEIYFTLYYHQILDIGHIELPLKKAIELFSKFKAVKTDRRDVLHVSLTEMDYVVRLQNLIKTKDGGMGHLVPKNMEDFIYIKYSNIVAVFVMIMNATKKDKLFTNSQLHTMNKISSSLMKGNSVVSFDCNREAFTYFGSVDGHLPFVLPVLDANDLLSFISQEVREEYSLSAVKVKRVNFKRYLKEQIRARYLFTERPLNGKRNVIMDSFFPRMVYNSDLNLDRFHIDYRNIMPSTAFAISEVVANSLNIPKIPTIELCKVLGYKDSYIQSIIKKVRDKKLRFCFIGAGGTGVNCAYWMKELLRMTAYTYIFDKVYVYEGDSLETSNLLRFPIDIRTARCRNEFRRIHNKISKNAYIVDNAEAISRRVPEIHNSYLKTQTRYYGNDLFETDQNSGNRNKVCDDVVMYGAPGIEARKVFSDLGNFIAGLHSEDTADLWLNPNYEDEDTIVESYGLISLGSFFMNQLHMTISLLEFLASDDLDLREKDKRIKHMKFDGEIKIKTRRKYEWQLENNGMMTEEDSFIQ